MHFFPIRPKSVHSASWPLWFLSTYWLIDAFPLKSASINAADTFPETAPPGFKKKERKKKSE